MVNKDDIRMWKNRLRFAEYMLAGNRGQRREVGGRHAKVHYVQLRRICLEWFERHGVAP